MGWRTVILSDRAKVDLNYEHLVIRKPEGNKRIYIPEISTIIVESTGISITTALMSELIQKKVKVIFCDEKRDPISELVPLYGRHDCSLSIRKQIEWTEDSKNQVWTAIVREKILNQAYLLDKLRCDGSNTLRRFVDELEYNDESNREALAAKVYFSNLFGTGFSRDYDTAINAALNYGYQIILSTFNREIVSQGYLTQVGIFHNNRFNPFNLASDFMEPFRYIVDEQVYRLSPEVFATEQKREIQKIANRKFIIDQKEYYLDQAVKTYTISVLKAIETANLDEIRFIRNEL